jgi:hypothetical protein
MEYKKGQIIEGREGKRYVYLGGDPKDRASYTEMRPSTLTPEQQAYARQGEAAAAKGGLRLGEDLTRQSMQEETAGRSEVGKALAGVGGDFDRSAYALKKLFTDLTPEEQNRVLYGDEMQQNPAGRLGGIVSKAAIATPALVGGGAFLGGAGLGGVIPQAIGAGAIGAGTSAAVTPENRGQAALAGGLGAMTGTAIGGGLSGLARPAAGSSAQALQAQGARLTPGQARGGLVKRVEDAGKVIFDPAISQAQIRGIEGWNKTMINNALKPTGATVTSAGHEGLSKAREAFSKAYEKVDGVALKRDPAASIAVHQVVKTNKPDIVDHATLNRVSGRVQELLSRPDLTFGALRTKASDLTEMAKKADDPALARVYRQMANALDDMRARSGAASPELDKGYAQFMRMEEAAGMKGAMDTGVFSPDQLRAAIKAASTTSQRAEGNALLQAETARASGVLGNTIPAVGPGSAEKLLAGAGLVPMTAYALGHPLAAAGLLSGYGAGRLSYTGPGTKFMTGAYPWQQHVNPAYFGAAGEGLLGQQ